MAKTLRAGILAGEMSGDVLGAGLMQALKMRYPDIRFTGIGGPLMQGQGLQSEVPMDRLSVMGLVEPLKRLPELLRIRRNLRDKLLADPPDVFIGIDSPDFNLGLEKQLKAAGIPVVHYVSPSVWAWRQKRIHKIRQSINLMLTLFPFEAEIYEHNDIPVRCVGHPLADQMPLQVDTPAARRELGLDERQPVLALLPGSRQGEVAKLAPAFLDTAALCQREAPGLQVLMPAAGEERKAQLQQMLGARRDVAVTLVDGRAKTVMAAADRILIASGTATLEALLCKKPMVVCYRMAPLSYAIISRMLRVPYFSLPNLLAQKAIVPEVVQDAVNGPNLFRLLQDLKGKDEATQASCFADIHESLRLDASEQAASAVLELINTHSSTQ